jgi:hypothetical protein
VASKRLFVTFHNNWKDLNPRAEYNWHEFAFVHLSAEKDKMVGQWSLMACLLGLWVTVTYTYDPSMLEAMQVEVDRLFLQIDEDLKK